MKLRQKVVVIGGCGHVGLPLGVKFALAGYETSLIDIDEKAIARVNSGEFPFLEKNGPEQLAEALKLGLRATSDIQRAREADVLVFVIGTPVDEHLNPKLSEVVRIFDQYQDYFAPGALVVMRSTLFPGTMEHLYNRLKQRNVQVRLAFCPERVAQGFALDEIDSLPQIVSAFDEESFQAAYELFRNLAPEIVRLTPLEAEMTKLMANAWRYLEFAIANQFYVIAEKSGVDFQRIYQAIRYKYPRANGYKSPGLAAGPCLFKDTMQLASYFDHQFYFGHSAMLVNEGLATFIVEKTAALFGGKLWGKSIGLLGLAFKANSDDVRESLSFKVRKGLEFQGAIVVANDPFVASTAALEPSMNLPVDQLVQQSDAMVLCCPHDQYRKLKTTKPIVDVWGFFSKPELEILPGRQEEPLKRVQNF